MKKIAIYGKGGIGKSTTVSNLAYTLAKMGYRVFQIGCDPKSDSTVNHNGGKRIPTVLDKMRAGEINSPEDFIFLSDSGVYCIETGGPIPGTGCAGRGIITAFECMDEMGVYEKYKPDFVLYDVLGDVVCGGFAMPLRNGYSDEVYIVTSGEMMSLFAADNIVRAVKNLGGACKAKIGGLIVNKKNIDNEEAIITAASKEMDVPIIQILPRDSAVQSAEALGKTAADAFPDSFISTQYRALAEKIINGQ